MACHTYPVGFNSITGYSFFLNKSNTKNFMKEFRDNIIDKEKKKEEK